MINNNNILCQKCFRLKAVPMSGGQTLPQDAETQSRLKMRFTKMKEAKTPVTC